MKDRLLTILLLVAAFMGFSVVGILSEELPTERLPFGKEPGSIYLGGTSGLSGLDSVRGLIDSLYYAKWSQGSTIEWVAGPAKVIYGDDDRRDIYTVTDPNLLKLAQAAFVLVSGSEISDNGDGTYDLTTNPWTMQGGLPLCEDERFSGQSRLGRCSGFLVGEDLVVTAGHCMSTCGTNAFIFGYQQTDFVTAPAMTVSADDVYFCSEVVEWAYLGDLDHCLVRLDRPVVGHEPIPIRRQGLVAEGDPLVVVGHPKTLPMKVAAGAEVKDSRGTTPWFQANLDTYGGSSGSMVVNTDTWEIEGILVRGAPDFVFTTCAGSNRVPNTGNTGGGLEFEEISKIETIAHLIPVLVASLGEVFLDEEAYDCTGQIEIELRDLDLVSQATYDLLLFTSAADSELVALVETGSGTGVFEGNLTREAGVAAKYDGRLQLAHGDLLVAEYIDDDDGTGSPVTTQVTANVYCQPPVISGVSVIAAEPTWATISFATDAPAAGLVRVGTACGSYEASAASAVGTSHEITVSNLIPATPYLFMVEATDPAGNVAHDDNSGACYALSTTVAPEDFTELFSSGCDLVGRALSFEPNGTEEAYDVCRYEGTAAWIETDAAIELSLSDDSFREVALSGGDQVIIFGSAYSSVFVGSNGFVTFGSGDTDWSETIDEHFGPLPRVAVFWDDLDPTQGGQVSYESLSDRLVVSWEDVPERTTSNLLKAQLQLFFDGEIVLCYRTIGPLDGLVGLSAGTGYPAGFYPSDMSEYVACEPIICFVDSDGDTYGALGDPGHNEPGPVCGLEASGNNLDCDDTRADVYPGAEEISDDAIDQDCDGVDPSCCSGTVGDVNGQGGDAPTIGDVSLLINHLFIDGAPLDCLQEADINQSGGRYPGLPHITISDISVLIDHLFISNPVLNDCL